MNQSKLYIQAICNDQQSRNLSCQSWSDLTGKSADLIRVHYKKKKKRGLNNREIVGLVDIGYTRVKEKAKPMSTKSLIDDGDLMALFLRRRLV